VIVSFESRELQATCLEIATAEDRLGAAHAQALITLISELEAFQHAEEAIGFIGNAEVRKDDSLVIPVGSRYLATFVAVGAQVRNNRPERTPWSDVSRLKIVAIEEAT
jgi:hypothetical protein